MQILLHLARNSPCCPRKWHFPEKPNGSQFLQVASPSQTSLQNIPRGAFVKAVSTGFLAPTSYEASSHLQSASSRPSPPTLPGGKPSTSCLTMATPTQQGKHTLGGYHRMSLTSLGSTAGSSCVPLIFVTI